MPLPFQRRGGAQLRPTFSRDFAGLKTLDHGVGPAITFTRASNATFFDASGVLQTASNDAPRFDHSSTGSSLGLLIEEARTNSIRNSQAGGATNGVIGSGGVLPTNWSNFKSAGDLEVIGSGTENGFSYVDVRFYGTNSTGADAGMFVSADGLAQIVASSGQTWTSTMYIKLQAGSLSNVTTFMRVVERDSSSLQLAVTSTSFTPTSSFERISATRTLNNASTTRVTGQVSVVFPNSATIDLTLRIAAPQLEQGAFPTSYIPTTTAAATRSADSAVVTPISSFYNQSEGTLFAEGFPTQSTGSASSHLLSIGNSGTEYLSLLRLTSGTTARGYSFISSLVADLNGGSFTDSGKLALAYKQDDFAFSFNGGTVATDTSGNLPTADRMRIGSRVDTGSIANGHIRKIAYYPRRLSNTLLQQLTT